MKFPWWTLDYATSSKCLGKSSSENKASQISEMQHQPMPSLPLQEDSIPSMFPPKEQVRQPTMNDSTFSVEGELNQSIDINDDIRRPVRTSTRTQSETSRPRTLITVSSTNGTPASRAIVRAASAKILA